MPAALAQEHAQALATLLQSCTALIQTKDGRSNGAGFFIDEKTVLTCAHVVKQSELVDVTPYRRSTRTGTVTGIRTVADGDIALVSVGPGDDDSEPQPAVLLDINVDSGDYHAAGFPSDENFAQGLEVIKYDGRPRRDQQTGALLGVQLVGAQVTFGMSGGPVLNDRTGAVVAMTQSSKGTETVLGGGAIPIAVVAEAFAEVAALVKSPPAAARLWRNAIPRAAWADVGRDWPEHCPTFDIRVAGSLSRWLVALESDRQPLQELTVRDLSEEVAEVLFKWAHTRALRGADEVQLLGRLLSGALLPKGLAQRLIQAQKAEELYVRLRVDRDNELADVPWELATLPGTREGLAAVRHIRFTRVVHELGQTPSSLGPRRDAVPVLGMVVQPDSFKYPDVFYDGSLVEWPEVSHVTERLKALLGKAPFTATICENPTPAVIDSVLEEAGPAPFEVFHYVGLARLRQTDLEFAFESDGGASWVSKATLCDWVARSGARVAVIEVTLPPNGLESEPVPLSALVRDIEGPVHAVIATRAPVHTRQFQPFNDHFYACIAKGDTVEAAVQSGRRALQLNNPLGDHAGFGWFTLTTGERAGLRLYAGAPRSAARGTRETAGAGVPSERQAPPQEERRDDFQLTG